MGLLEDLREKRDRFKKIILPTEKEQCLRMIQDILQEYSKESDIPYVHHYWELKNFYRGMK